MRKMFLLFIFALFLAVSCDKESGLYCPDGYSCWQEICEPDGTEKYRKLFFVDTRTGWRIGQEGLIMKTTDGGISWKTQTSPAANNLTAVVFTDASTGFIVGYKSTLLYTTDGGDHWSQRNVCADSTKHNTDIFFVDQQHGWFINNHGEIFQTEDGGDTWQPLFAFSSMGWCYLQFVNSSTGFASGLGTRLMKTVNGGQDWKEIRIDVPNALMDIMIKDIYFFDESTGYFAFEWLSGGHCETATPIMKTTDGGYRWAFQDSLATPSLRCLFFNNENTGWIAGDTFWKTTDGGYSWKQCPEKVDSDVIVDLFFLDKTNGWALGRNGSVYRYGY